MDFQPILDDVISIYPPSNAIDQMFKTVTQGSALVTNLSCAIEPEEPDQMEETEFQGKKGFRQKFTCFIANTVEGLNQKLSYPYGSTVIDQNGQVYVIEGWKSSDRLDLLQELKLRINP
jgi:5,10-methenyltetrahydromethanopterin hydrogenase